MQTYETLLITPPNLAEEEEQAAVEALAGVITDGGGTVHANDRMGRRHLAYPIQKFDDGVYIRFLYDSEAEVPKELERRSRLSDKVLRTLTVRLTKEWAEDAKKQAVIDAARRVEEAKAKAEAEAKAAEEAAAAAKAEAEKPADEAATETATETATEAAAAGEAQPATAEAVPTDAEASADDVAGAKESEA